MPSPAILKFLVLCLVWGLTWIATKVGIGAVPPPSFAATRFIVAGVLVSLWMWRETHFSKWQKNDVIRLFAASLLMVTLTYGPLYCGMRYEALDGWCPGDVFDAARASRVWHRPGQERWNWMSAIGVQLPARASRDWRADGGRALSG